MSAVSEVLEPDLRCPRVGLSVGVVRGAYPERGDERLSKLDELGRRVVAPLWRRLQQRERGARGWRRVPALVRPHAEALDAASAAELQREVTALRFELACAGFRDDLVARSFALVRETAKRTLGYGHYDVQLMGGWVMLHGKVAEMQTGEGKTLTATLPACTAALAGVPVHIITVNDYLAARDADVLGPVYAALGLSLGVIVSGMDVAARRSAYACDVTYCTNKEVAFDYLKDRIALEGHPSRRSLALEALAGRESRSERSVHRGLYFAIVDEADSVLIDEARTPLIISERKHDSLEEDIYREGVAAARRLEAPKHFSLDESERLIRINEEGSSELERLLSDKGGLWRGPRRREEFVRQALAALHLFHRDQHYLVATGDDGKQSVQIVDEYTGRVMPDRSWEHGLHQMIEVKEGVELTGRQDTLARISYQRFFRRYHRIAGMTGTGHEVAGELWNAYRMPVVTIPPHRPCQRIFLGERVLLTAAAKWQAVVERIDELHQQGRPVLVGTRSVAASEVIAERLVARGISHRVLNARQDADEAEIVASAGEAGRVTVATNMAGRGTDIALGEGVAGLGGLHVLATERHDAARIDRQLFGRSARQGDPGSCESIVSLEDELCTTHGGWLAAWARAVAKPLGRLTLAQPLGRLALAQAQRRAGRLHARIRRDLLKADTQLDTLLAFSGRPD
jgi:preprotein translocase subunit SecA